MAEFQISDVSKYSPGQWKSMIIRKIEEKNSEELLNNMKANYKKIDHKVMRLEKYELKPYIQNLHLSEARDKFRLRSFMTRTVKTNFPVTRGTWQSYGAAGTAPTLTAKPTSGSAQATRS